HQHLLVAEAVGNGCEVGLGVGHQHVFSLGAIDEVAEAPAGGGLVTVATALAGRDQVAAVLRGGAVLCGVGVEVRADRAGDHALAFAVALYRAAEFFDHTDRLMADGEAGHDRIFAFQDVYVGAADRGRGDADQGVVGTD